MDTDFLLYELKRKCWPMCSPQLGMFNLFSNCCNWMSKFQQPIRKATVLMVGLDNSGKTSTIRGILKAPPREQGPTSECVHTELSVDNFLVTMLDVGGSVQARGTWRDHYGEAHGIIFVVDSSDRQRVPEAKELLVNMLKHPKVIRKPLLLLANKQDKTNALLISELIEALSLEHLVNQSRSLCHIEACSALVDLRRWSDRKTLRGLRWLLQAMSLDYPDLCARVARDCKTPAVHEDKDRHVKAEKCRGNAKDDKIRSNKTDQQQRWDVKGKEKKSPQISPPAKPEPTWNTLKPESASRKHMKKKQVQIKHIVKSRKQAKAGDEKEKNLRKAPEVATEQTVDKSEKPGGAPLPRNHEKAKHKMKKVTKETLQLSQSEITEDVQVKTGKGEKKKRKTIKVKKKRNKINSEDMTCAQSHPQELSAPFDLYRKAILALKTRQDK